jgi:hypothetical protein
VTNQWWNDDDTLLAMLNAARQALQEVPREIVEAGRTAYTWRTIDAELADLTYDSDLLEVASASVTRAEPAPLRALTFATPDVTIELEVTDNTLFGQIVPPQTGLVTAAPDNTDTLIAIDEMGCFTISPIPTGPFRLRCQIESGDVLTGWITP